MGEYEELSGLLLNGLLPNDSASVFRVLDGERWVEAEKRTAELIACIQPNLPSENQRGAVAGYVQRLIIKCFPCQVVTFGSVPLKTYLPDGDIDVTAFSKNQNLKDTWALQVRDILKSEEKNENAEFLVKEVQYIQAEVKIIKCLVENIVVDISFNQLGGLCTLCFLEEVDNLISQDHLFKRSIILIKAWCYYESRILGAHHGLISTYALETLVLYIFHIYNNSLTGPLEVLYRFLEFFCNFDWENFCVSLWGPVPVSSLPEINAEPPRKDGGELLLSKVFLQACNSVYAVFPSGLENQGQPFISKHFNVIDPLRVNNNLGRSVNKGNFYRIRSAFAFGAKRIARLLDCPKENIAFELNQFFTNTWDRHGNGIRPDAQTSDLACLRPSNLNHGSDNQYNSPSDKEGKTDSSVQCIPIDPEKVNSELSIESKRSQKTSKHGQIVNQLQGKHLFARTRSSPELTGTYLDKSSRSKPAKPAESVKSQVSFPKMDNKTALNTNIDDTGTIAINDDYSSVIGAQGMQQEEQDLVNMMATSSLHNFGGHLPMPLNLGSTNLPISLSQSVLASIYGQRNVAGMFPANAPVIDPNWGRNFQFYQGLMSSPLSQYFSGVGLSTNSEYLTQQDVASTSMRNDENNKLIEIHSDERISASRKSSASQTGSVRSKTSSESSWDDSSARVSRLGKEKRGEKAVTPKAQVKGKNISEFALSEADDEPTDNNSGQGRFTVYPTGPPVPFFTMLPVYNYQGQTDKSEPSSSDSGQASESTQSNTEELFDTPKCDILNSDFASHWQNLQFGQLCQGVRYPAPVIDPSPPVYLQGHVPWDGPGRPVSGNVNMGSQVMSYGQHLVPVIPLQSDTSRPNTVYQRYADELLRYCSGTGTYLPNPKVSVSKRGARRSNYNYERSDHADREGNWNAAKSRASGRNNHNHNRIQADKNRADRPWAAHRHHPPYQSQNGSSRPGSSHSNVVYSLPGGITPNGQSLVMLYPYGNQHEFRSLGYVGRSDASQSTEDQRYHRSSTKPSSPDPPSSPHFHRRS